MHRNTSCSIITSWLDVIHFLRYSAFLFAHWHSHLLAISLDLRPKRSNVSIDGHPTGISFIDHRSDGDRSINIERWFLLSLFIWCLHSNEVTSSFQPNQNLYVFFSLQIRNQFSEWKPHTIDICSKHLKIVARHLLQCHCPSSPEYRMDRARCQQAYHLIHWLFPCFWIAIGFEKQTIKIQTVIRRSSHILALIGTFGIILSCKWKKERWFFVLLCFTTAENETNNNEKNDDRVVPNALFCVFSYEDWYSKHLSPHHSLSVFSVNEMICLNHTNG